MTNPVTFSNFLWKAGLSPARRTCLMIPLVFLLLMSCAGSREIREKSILFNQERTDLSLQYLKDRYGLEQSAPVITPKMIVLHYTVIPTLEKSWEAFNTATLPDTRGEIHGAGMLNVSAHFLVDRDGSIYRLMPETRMARHVIGLNHCAIGIENIGGTPDLPLTRAQRKSNVWLIRHLKEKYDIDYLIGHSEYTRFEGHELWLEKDTAYRTRKADPGKEYMRKVRKAVKNLNFKPLPFKDESL